MVKGDELIIYSEAYNKRMSQGVTGAMPYKFFLQEYFGRVATIYNVEDSYDHFKDEISYRINEDLVGNLEYISKLTRTIDKYPYMLFDSKKLKVWGFYSWLDAFDKQLELFSDEKTRFSYLWLKDLNNFKTCHPPKEVAEHLAAYLTHMKVPSIETTYKYLKAYKLGGLK